MRFLFSCQPLEIDSLAGMQHSTEEAGERQPRFCIDKAESCTLIKYLKIQSSVNACHFFLLLLYKLRLWCQTEIQSKHINEPESLGVEPVP